MVSDASSRLRRSPSPQMRTTNATGNSPLTCLSRRQCRPPLSRSWMERPRSSRVRSWSMRWGVSAAPRPRQVVEPMPRGKRAHRAVRAIFSKPPFADVASTLLGRGDSISRTGTTWEVSTSVLEEGCEEVGVPLSAAALYGSAVLTARPAFEGWEVWELSSVVARWDN
jgi:hypothetical protein